MSGSRYHGGHRYRRPRRGQTKGKTQQVQWSPQARLAFGVVVAIFILVAVIVSVVSGGGHAKPAATAQSVTSTQTTNSPATAFAAPSNTVASPAPATTSAPAVTPPVTAARGPQPADRTAPSFCHARGSGLYSLPDPSCTPGATDPSVTQANIDSTICRSGWTETVRPPESYTEPLKYKQMATYRDAGSAGNYEEDHLIPLELGGNPTSPQNLWPEPGASPNPKDGVEDAANHAVCDGQMTLAAAQQAIASNWIALGEQLRATSPPSSPSPLSTSPPTASSSTSQSAWCRASASPSNDGYPGDFEVYVHSNQPDREATASDTADTWSHETDSSGYADIRLYRTSSGMTITVTVGAASCTTLA